MPRKTMGTWGAGLVLAGCVVPGFSSAADVVETHPAGYVSTFAPAQQPMVVIDASKARAWIVQIELALLADPVTFPYVLQTQAGPQGMEVRGFVPHDGIKARALAVAKQCSPLPIVDKVSVDGRMAAAMPTRAGRDVQTLVTERIENVNPSRTAPVQVAKDPEGAVLLKGMATSLEEKLSYSRALRGIPGCRAVVNHMEVVDSSTTAAPAPLPPAPQVVSSHGESKPAPVEPPKVALSGYVMTDVPPEEPLVLPELAPSPRVVSKTDNEHKKSVPAARAPVSPSTLKPATADATPPTQKPAARASLLNFGSKPREQLTKEPVTTRGAATGQGMGTAIVPASATKTTQANTIQQPKAPPPVPPYVRPAPARGMPDQRSLDTLRHKIKGVYKDAARDVELRFDGKGNVRVIVHLVGDVEPRATVQQVLQIPELHPYEVEMEFRME